MNAGWYRKKPIAVQAVYVNDALYAAASAWGELPAWLADAYERGEVIFARDHVSVSTLEGVMRANRDDWILRGVRGELYPCNGEIFAETYEPAEAEQVKG